MLYILTGETESGKTTWICDFVNFLEKQNVPVAGVVAPGEWEEDVHNNKKSKVAINNILLPSHIKIQIATRKLSDQGDINDLASKISVDRSPVVGTNTNNEKYVPKKWNFDSTAFNKVNNYFEKLKQSDKHAVLIIDELGPKELEYNEGLNHAVELLKHGPSKVYQDAIIVVRQHLVDAARTKFSAWCTPTIINTNTCFGSILDNLCCN